jgi:hypothetical protein
MLNDSTPWQDATTSRPSQIQIGFTTSQSRSLLRDLAGLLQTFAESKTACVLLMS